MSKRRSHRRGAVGIAHLGEPAKGDSQLYITLDDRHDLDGKYVVFGQVVDGGSVPGALTLGDDIVKGGGVDSHLIRGSAPRETLQGVVRQALADAQPDLQTRELPGRLSAEALAQRIAMTGVWSDHSTTDVFPAECPRLLLAWVFRPGHVHWIEAAHP